VVVLDTSSSDRIAPVDPDEPVVIDHHEPGDLVERARAAVVDPEAGATAELVVLWAASTGRLLPPRAALPLAVGLLADTGGLEHATARTVRVAARLLGSLGHRTGDLPRLFEVTGDGSGGEHNAVRLGTLRATGYRAGETVVAFTTIGGYEAAAATALRSVGIDLVVVCSEREDGLTVVARATEAFGAETSLGAELLPALADRFGGEGGGHAGAGAATLEDATVVGVVDETLSILERERGLTFSPIEHTPDRSTDD
jgi:nanoRNase/pAp phosphatase (c-di-AMP/oligoRNAs hydrolase)